MKGFKLILFVSVLSLFMYSFSNSILSPEFEIIKEETTVVSKFDEGFKDGYCEGWKDEKGKNAYCPYPPYPPYPTYEQSRDSYRDGYNTGFKQGVRDARKS